MFDMQCVRGGRFSAGHSRLDSTGRLRLAEICQMTTGTGWVVSGDAFSLRQLASALVGYRKHVGVRIRLAGQRVQSGDKPTALAIAIDTPPATRVAAAFTELVQAS